MTGSIENFNKMMNLGHSTAWDQQWEQAAQAYLAALEEFPENPKALTSLGLALFELGRFDDSLLAYQKAVQASPDDPVPMEKAARLSARRGKTADAITLAMKAAELYIRHQEVEKAIETWVYVTQLNPPHLQARTYLAMVHEKLEHKEQALNEYLAVASLLQQAGNIQKAGEMIGRALKINPASAEARQAENMLKTGITLPKPYLSVGNTGSLRSGGINPPASQEAVDSSLDPVEEANKKALARLAEMLFDLSEDEKEYQSQPGGSISSILQGLAPMSGSRGGRSRIILFVGQAIDSQISGEDGTGIEDLEKAIDAGLKDQAAYFNYGYLLSKKEGSEKALRSLQVAVKNSAYAMPARLLMGEIQLKLGHPLEAASEYMEALRIADSLCVPQEQGAELRQAYEPYIEAQTQVTDIVEQEKVCANIKNMLLHPDWRTNILQAREQLPEQEVEMPLLPLAEILVQVQNTKVIDAIGRIHKLAKANLYRTAMEEAYTTMVDAPYYLPLHLLIGDLLTRQGYTQEAMAKYNVVAEAYGSRGEAAQAVTFLRRIVKSSPMNLQARARLIDQLTDQGLVEDAISEYLDLADIHYRLSELDQARKTYATALNLAREGNAKRAWSVKLLQRMADIDMQRLDWNQAIEVYKQLRDLNPADARARKDLIQVYFRLDQSKEAADELAGYLVYLQGNARQEEVLPFLEEFIKDDPRRVLLHRVLAEQYFQAGRVQEAAAQLAEAGAILLEAGDLAGAKQIVGMIQAMDPPDISQFSVLMEKTNTVE